MESIGQVVNGSDKSQLAFIQNRDSIANQLDFLENVAIDEYRFPLLLEMLQEGSNVSATNPGQSAPP